MNWFSRITGVVTGRSELDQLAARISEIRARRGGEVATTMSLHGVEISQADYGLMGSDNSCAKRNFPNVKDDERHEGRWFKGADDLDGSKFMNMHGTQRSNGTWRVDSFYTTLPPRKYQSDPREVAWQFIRVRELRATGMSVDERIATLKREAATKPWATA